jgi:hypothetical protein
LLASSNAPALSQLRRNGPRRVPLTITNLAGPIYFTTNGVDPRVAFTGAVAPGRSPELHRTDRHPAPLLLRARSLVGTNWSAVTEAVFEVNRLGVPLAITEIMYNPPGGEAFEFLELPTRVRCRSMSPATRSAESTFRFPDAHAAHAGGRPLDSRQRSPTLRIRRALSRTTVAGWFDGS